MAILHVVPKFIGEGPQEYQASFWMELNQPPTVADIPEVSDNVRQWLEDMYSTIETAVRVVVLATEFAMYLHDLNTGLESHFADGAWSFQGTSTTDSEAPQIAATVSAKVSTRDRPAQKRMIPFTGARMSEGILTSAAITELAAFSFNWVVPRPASSNFTYTPGLVSVGAPGQFNPFTGVSTINTVVGTLRSRKRGVGI
jgi:hypothetical protein